MTANDETVIELDRRKIVLGFVGTVVFVAVGIWLVMLDDSRVASGKSFRLLMNSPLLAHALGVVSILFFGALGVFLVKKVFDKKPGLVFSAGGLLDNAGATAAGLIPWEDIDGYDVLEISGRKMLIVMVGDPQRYIERGNAVRRRLNLANFNMAGSPISISTRTLRTNLDELIDLFERYFTKYGRPGDGAIDGEK
jgi:hypothetical protein